MPPGTEGFKLFEQNGIVALELYGLTIARMMGIFIQAPIFGSKHIPMKLRIAIALVTATAIFPILPMPKEFSYNLSEHVVIVMNNVLVGLVIGYVAFLTMTTIQFAGELIDTQLGLSAASSFDPSAGGTVNLMRRLHFYMAMMVYLIIDGHHTLFTALYRSFQAVPVDQMAVLNGTLVRDIISLTACKLMLLGVQLCAPTLAALFIVQMALGLTARAAPQMNVFMISFPVNILVGTSMLAASIPYTLRKLIPIFDENYNYILKFLIIMKSGG
jgi:flagellar biosynthetic protein FliR